MNDQQHSRADALTVPRELLLDLIDDVQSFADQIPCREREKAFRADLLARARALAASPVGQPAAALIEETIRFCPECGRLGDIPAGFEACCPDWSQARVVPKRFAELCAETFRLCVSQPFPQSAAAPTDQIAHDRKMVAPADERAAFEKVFPMPADCQRIGSGRTAGYAPTEYGAWDAHDFIRRWEGWQARAAALPAADAVAWISVDDCLPDDETDVLVRKIRGSAVYYDIAGIFHGTWKSQVTEDRCEHEVTHWRPIDVAPQSDRTVPAVEGTVNTGDRLTDMKANDIIQRDGYKMTGAVLCLEDGSRCIVELGAVRWLTRDESWALMHPRTAPQPSQADAPAEAREPNETEQRIAAVCYHWIAERIGTKDGYSVQEHVDLKHDLERALANHAADLSAQQPSGEVTADELYDMSEKYLVRIQTERGDGHVHAAFHSSVVLAMLDAIALYKKRLGDSPDALDASKQQHNIEAMDDDKRDAERYRYLRTRPESVEPGRIDVVYWSALDESANEGEALRGDALDAAIDAARAGDKQ
ncbi:DUF551 domain-containing protein [Burkholderia sp. TSV86]|uniref:DUF551 domain-containing protein n=1 Tax=Burkholderia sp. TSV86 TaxID=1385594 RepID=UPI000754D25D|nr:DUF551 domain-containing protein [Burkholderia sp. TSV86]KVE37351.1 hypothetical protein WS68_02700 [Burkholderia sp. TSV86]